MFLRIGSYWLYFKSGVQKGVYCNGVILLAGKGRGKLHFLYIMASTGPIFNLEHKKAFLVMAFFFIAGKGSRKLHFLCVLALTGPILNWGYKMAFVGMVFFCHLERGVEHYIFCAYWLILA